MRLLPAVWIAVLAAAAAVEVPGVQAVDEDPFYEILRSWPDAFKANFCLTAPQDLFGWKVQIHFHQPVASMQIWRAAVRTHNTDMTVFHLGDRFWNRRWLTGERNCFQFVASDPGLQTGIMAKKVFFSEIVVPTGCASQIDDQHFSISITRHWGQGLSGSFCLTPPRDFHGDWKIRVEFDKSLLRLASSKADAYDVSNRRHWLMLPKSQTSRADGGQDFCLDFTAFTRRMVSPCIRAFFTEQDGRTPASDTPPLTTTTPDKPAPPVDSTTPMSSSSSSSSSQSDSTTTTQASSTGVTSATTTQPVTTTTERTTTTTATPPPPPTTLTTTTTTTKTTTKTTPSTQTTTTKTTAQPSSGAGWGGAYTQVSLWNAGVSGRLCLDHTIDITCGWEIDIRFDPAIDRLDIWKGDVSTTTQDGSANIFRVVNKNYNFAMTDNPVCYDFNGYKSYSHGPQVTGRFTRICSNNKWTDVTQSSPGVTTTSSSVTTANPGSGSSTGGPSPPVMTGNKNQDMLDLYLNTYDGDGTYYGEGQEGTCTYHQTSFPPVGLSNQIDALAALNHIIWHNSKACGMCFRVRGEGKGLGNDPIDGEYIVFVKDLCPSGACSLDGSVDFAQNGDGRWDIEIQAVQCPVGNNKLTYSFQGSNPWYLKLQVANYRIPPNEVSIQRNGVWKPMTKTSDGYWTLSDKVEMTNTKDIPVRVTAINGEQLYDTIPELVSGRQMDGGQGFQFSLDPNLPTIGTQVTNAPATQTSTTKLTTTQTPTTNAGATKNTTMPATTTPPKTLDARYDYGDALSKSLLFYLAQRSGPLPDNVISWRGDSALNDGTQGPDGQWRDLTGGWYDAGDFLKLNFPMAGSTTVLLWGLIKFENGYSASGQLQRMREVVRWPLDYFLKAWDPQNQILYGQVGNVNLDHAFWGRPEDMTMARPVYSLTPTSPGSDMAAETAAALAAGYLAFKDTDSSYADDLLEAARSVYDFADSYREYYHLSITDAESAYKSWGYEDELCWGAAWLYKATGESTYKIKAEQAVNAGGLDSTEFSWDEKGVGCAVLLYEIETDPTKKQQYADVIEDFTSKWINGNGMSVTPCGLSWLRKWGSLRYALNGAMISLMAAESGLSVTANRDWALSQINFALGDNKHGRSYVVGFGVNPPERPHHAASSCPSAPADCDWSNFNLPDPNPQILYGALVGGPDQNGNYVDDRTDYIMNEVACDYNAGFQTVLAGFLSLQSRGELPVANPACPQPRSGGSTSGTSPPPAPTTGPSGPTSPPDLTGNVNQDMLDLYSNSYSGDGTYYGEGQEGTCTYHQTSFPPVGLSNQIDALAALNHIIWHNSKACGMCFRVTANGVGLGNDPLNGEYIVFIKDLCPSGACSLDGSVDFAQNGDGRWDIEIQAVQCPVGNNKLTYSFQGSNPWYLKLQVANYRIPPNEVSIQRNGVWKPMTKTSDGYWTLSDGVEMTNTEDIPVRVTAINGEQLTDTIPDLVSGVQMNGGNGVQFALDASLPSVP